MNKNILIGVIVFVVLLAGAAGYMMISNRSESISQNPSSQSSKKTAGIMQKASLKSLMSMGNNQTCSFQDNESTNSGTVYISSGKFRGDFSSNLNGSAVGSHMISDGGSVYVWMDSGKEGFKMSLDSLEDVKGEAQKTVDINKEVDYSCSDWSVDSTKFSVPTDITFKDYSAMMENVTNMMKETSNETTTTNSTTNQAACAACNNLAGDMKAQCLSSLKCN